MNKVHIGARGECVMDRRTDQRAASLTDLAHFKMEQDRSPRSTSDNMQFVINSCACRATTSLKSAASDRRKKEEEYRKKMMAEMASRKNVSAVRRLTQEELLEEAKETEKQVS